MLFIILGIQIWRRKHDIRILPTILPWHRQRGQASVHWADWQNRPSQADRSHNHRPICEISCQRVWTVLQREIPCLFYCCQKTYWIMYHHTWCARSGTYRFLFYFVFSTMGLLHLYHHIILTWCYCYCYCMVSGIVFLFCSLIIWWSPKMVSVRY